MRRNLAVIGFIAIATLIAAVLLHLDQAAAQEEDKDELSPARMLTFPKIEWARTFPDDVNDLDMAGRTGQVAACTSSRVYYFTDTADAVWTAGEKEGWKYVNDVGLNWDGSRVLFQTDVKKRKSTEGMDLTLHLLDGQGNELWQKPNPYRYLSARLSPSGKYILLGEVLHPGTRVFDENMNLLWEKTMQFWYVEFDPTERYVFDGEGGILYTMDGVQVWDFGRYTRILSVSDEAEYVLTTFYRTVKNSQRMFLMGRLALKKIELAGAGGAVSPDGTYTAYVNQDQKLVIYRTKELMTSGVEGLPPLFKTDFVKPWAMRISRDNRTLFVFGQENSVRSVMMLVDLTRMKTAWKRQIADDIRIALPTEDNRQVVVKFGPRIIKKYRCY